MSPQTTVTFASQLKAIRTAQGWTRRELAEAMANAAPGLTGKRDDLYTMIGRWETGRTRLPHRFYRSLLCNILSIPPDALTFPPQKLTMGSPHYSSGDSPETRWWLLQEEHLIWAYDPRIERSAMRYVRACWVDTRRRTGVPSLPDDSWLLAGYTTLRHTARSTSDGYFPRRLFFLKPHDRGGPEWDPRSAYGDRDNHYPAEAVDQRFVAVGAWN